MSAKKIVCTVTNDLNYDQRMIRICTSLATAGYQVMLIGRKRKNSLPLQTHSFEQKRLNCFFEKGKLFYLEYTTRLFIYLLFTKTDLICAIDLDTILPCLFVSRIRRTKRVYDAHELFCEMEEIVSRPHIYSLWKSIEKYAVPKFTNGYTIGECYANEFKNMYQVDYKVVRNATVLKPFQNTTPNSKYILYQGAVNEGRSFETLIPAMQHIDATLIICGQGNFYEQAIKLTEHYNLNHKIHFKGYIAPSELKEYTKNAYIGITLFTNQGKSNYLSMANRFFDYMHFCIPQLCMSFPEYKKVNAQFEISYLIEDTKIDSIVKGLNELLDNKELHERLKLNCLLAREEYCWQKQETTLLKFYSNLLG